MLLILFAYPPVGLHRHQSVLNVHQTGRRSTPESNLIVGHIRHGVNGHFGVATGNRVTEFTASVTAYQSVCVCHWRRMCDCSGTYLMLRNIRKPLCFSNNRSVFVRHQIFNIMSHKVYFYWLNNNAIIFIDE